MKALLGEADTGSGEYQSLKRGKTRCDGGETGLEE